MAAAQAHADAEWKKDAYNAVKWCAAHYKEFSTNEVWDRLQASTSSTHEHRAMGPVMMRAARRGLVTNTNRVVTSKIPYQHGRKVALWRSCIHKSFLDPR